MSEANAWASAHALSMVTWHQPYFVYSKLLLYYLGLEGDGRVGEVAIIQYEANSSLIVQWRPLTNIEINVRCDSCGSGQRLVHCKGPRRCRPTSEVGWRVTFKVVDTLTGRPQMAGRPFEERAHELYRK